MADSPQSIRAQILVARDHYRSCFGCDPRGIWLPECAYVPEVEPALKEAGIRWFITETHGILHGEGDALLDAAQAAGARFGVSPGASAALLSAAARSGLPFVPGVMTPSDVINALDAGFDVMKLFPAAQAGGLDMLKAMSGPFPQVRFCPTGGVTLESAPALLKLKNVVCVGGSWLTPAQTVANGDWAAIQALARAAAALR